MVLGLFQSLSQKELKLLINFTSDSFKKYGLVNFENIEETTKGACDDMFVTISLRSSFRPGIMIPISDHDIQNSNEKVIGLKLIVSRYMSVQKQKKQPSERFVVVQVVVRLLNKGYEVKISDCSFEFSYIVETKLQLLKQLLQRVAKRCFLFGS